MNNIKCIICPACNGVTYHSKDIEDAQKYGLWCPYCDERTSSVEDLPSISLFEEDSAERRC